MKAFFTLALFSLISGGHLSASTSNAPAAPSAQIAPAPVTDPNKIRDQYQQVLARPVYREGEQPDARDEIKNWLSQWFRGLGDQLGKYKYLQEMPRFASLVTTVFVILCLAALLYIAIRLTRRKIREDRLSGPQRESPKTFRPPEFYEEELAKAVSAGDWHGAWMAGWRQFLSRLERAHLVATDRSRTNREYLEQLRRADSAAPAVEVMTHMVNSYDQFIYGLKPICEPDWNFFRQDLHQATLLLNLPQKSPS